jgi:hypothetical protein
MQWLSATTETAMSDAAKIHRDLVSLTLTLDLDRNQLFDLTMSDEQRKDIQHLIVRCLHSLRELEIAIEEREPGEDTEADFPV